MPPSEPSSTSVSLWAWRRRRVNDLAAVIGWLRRQRCVICRRRERYSWEGTWLPREWYCEDCTHRWMED